MAPQSLNAKAVQPGMMFAMFRHFLTSLPLSTHPPQLPFKEPIQLRTFYVDAPFWKLKLTDRVVGLLLPRVPRNSTPVGRPLSFGTKVPYQEGERDGVGQLSTFALLDFLQWLWD